MTGSRNLLKHSKVTAIYSVSNIEANTERAQHEINRELIDEIARRVTLTGHVEVTRRDYETEYRLSVYVLSGEELHRLINEEAMRLSGMISRNMNTIVTDPGEVKLT